MTLNELNYLTSTYWNKTYTTLTIDMTKDK